MSLSDLLAAEYGAIGALVAGREARDFLRPTGASAWCVQDLLFHQLLDAQRALVTIASPSDAEPDRGAVTYCTSTTPPAATVARRTPGSRGSPPRRTPRPTSSSTTGRRPPPPRPARSPPRRRTDTWPRRVTC